MTTKQLIPLSLLLLLGVVWGTGYSIARFAMTHDVPALGYSFWQSLGPAILIGLIAYKIPTHTKQISISHIRYYLICGLTGIAIPNTTMYFAASHLPAGLLAVIVNTVPIIVYPLAILAKTEQFDWTRFAGVALAIAGLLCIILPKVSLPDAAMIPWILITLLTPISFAVCAVYIARYRPSGTDSYTLAAGTLIASSILLTPLVLFSNSFYTLHIPLTLPDAVILLEIILSSLGYILFFQLIKIAGPVYYSLVDSIVALVGLFWGYIIFHETLNPWTSTAVTLILFGLVLVSKQQRAVLELQT